MRLRRSGAWRAIGIVLLLLTLVALPTVGRAADEGDGAVDTSFGIAGRAQINFGLANSAGANALLKLTYGDLVAAGSTLNGNGDPDAFALVAYDANGYIRDSFGDRGTVRTTFPNRSAGINALAIQADGKLVAAGRAGNDMALVRYQPDGTLDSSFGQSGRVLFNVGGQETTAQAVLLQADGKILVGGNSLNTTCSGVYYCSQHGPMVLARFNNDGSIDSGFANDGVITTTFTVQGIADTRPSGTTNLLILANGDIVQYGYRGSAVAEPGTVGVGLRFSPDGSADPDFGDQGVLSLPYVITAIQASGNKFWASGIGYNSPSSSGAEFTLARLNNDGTPDGSFGGHGNGSRTLDFQGADDVAEDLAIMPSGKLVMVGKSRPIGVSGPWTMAIARFNADGTLDTAFGPGGGQLLQRFDAYAEYDDIANAVVPLDDDRFAVAGSGAEGPGFVLAGFSALGVLDPQFANDFPPGFNVAGFANTDSTDQAVGMVRQPDGKVVVAGNVVNSPGSIYLQHDVDFGLARFNLDGTHDTTFGGSGFVTRNFDSEDDHAAALALQPDGKIIVVGYTGPTFLQPHRRIVVIRYNGDGTLDETFALGQLPTGLNESASEARTVLVQPDGKILIGGYYGDTVQYYHAFVLRLDATGQLDSSFADNGCWIFFASGAKITALALQPDGRILVGGYSGNGWTNEAGLLLLRLYPDGTIDSSGPRGAVVGPSADQDTEVQVIVYQPDGKILVIGTQDYRGHIKMFRLKPDGGRDPGFGDDGIVIGTSGQDVSWPRAALLEGDGKILIGGGLLHEPHQVLVRYLPNGQLDSSFKAGAGGLSDDGEVVGLDLLPNGRILAGGTIYSNHQAGDFALAHYKQSAVFSDIQPSDYFYDAVRDLTARGIVSGYGDGTFRPFNSTTRGQLSKIVTLAEGWTLANPAAATFTDVLVGSTFYSYIEIAYAHHIISGYDAPTGREFRPGSQITRGQLAKVITLAAGWPLVSPASPTFADVPLSDPFYSPIETAHAHSIIGGYDVEGGREFRPGASATRGQIAKIVYLLIQAGAGNVEKLAPQK